MENQTITGGEETMANYKITVNRDILQGLLSGNEDGMQKLTEEVLNQILEAQRTEHINAQPYERTEGRNGQRNGYKERKMTTRVGNLTLRIPQVRDGSFSTDLFKRYQRSEQALVLSLMEMVVNGVSTRKVSRITEELCGTEFSASTVSELCKNLDPHITEWNERDLSNKKYPFLMVDALVIKVRENKRVTPHSVLVAVGINEEGYREILGLKIGNSESEASWSELFSWLKDRGLNGVDFVVSDDHRGLVNAIQKHFQGIIWQRCQTHFMRNILDKCPKKYKQELHERIQMVLHAPDIKTARKMLEIVFDEFEEKAPKSLEILEDGFEDAIQVLHLPDKYRKRLRTTNSVERLNREIRRREKVICIFPNQSSAQRLIGSMLMEQHEEWSNGRRYFNMDEYWRWKNQQNLEQEINDLQSIIA